MTDDAGSNVVLGIIVAALCLVLVFALSSRMTHIDAPRGSITTAAAQI
jgi:hypothetical protein